MGKREYVLYEEVSGWPWWASAIVLAVLVGGTVAGGADVLRGFGGADPVALWRGLAVGGGSLLFGLGLWIGFGQLVVRVTRTSVLLGFGYTGLVEKLVPFTGIESVEAVRYRPLREFGGWGLRGSGSKQAWTIRGDGAVVLSLDDGKRLYVGSDHPPRLADRIRTAMGADRERDAAGGAGRG